MIKFITMKPKLKIKKVLGYAILIGIYIFLGWIAYLMFQDKDTLKVIFGDMWPISGIFAGAFIGLTFAGLCIGAYELISDN